MNTKHTRLPWGIERTRENNWIGPIRQDGSGKIAEIAFSNERGSELTQDASDRADANAELIVRAVNALAQSEGGAL